MEALLCYNCDTASGGTPAFPVHVKTSLAASLDFHAAILWLLIAMLSLQSGCLLQDQQQQQDCLHLANESPISCAHAQDVLTLYAKTSIEYIQTA